MKAEGEEEEECRGRIEPGGLEEGGLRVRSSQQDILFEPPNTISYHKEEGETLQIISHRRDTETLIVTLARGQV